MLRTSGILSWLVMDVNGRIFSGYASLCPPSLSDSLNVVLPDVKTPGLQILASGWR